MDGHEPQRPGLSSRPTPPSSGPTSSSRPTEQLRVHQAQRRPDPRDRRAHPHRRGPDYLAIAPDLTFRSRSRYLDDATGEWVSETEVIETAAELIELYNPADLYTAFAEAAREAAGLEAEPTGGRGPARSGARRRPRTRSAWTIRMRRGRLVGRRPATRPRRPTRRKRPRRLYELALDFQDRSQRAEARLFEQFEAEARAAHRPCSATSSIVDDEDERLTLGPRRHVPRRGHPGATRPGSGGHSARRTRSWGSTTRRMSSATWPTRSPRPSRASRRRRGRGGRRRRRRRGGRAETPIRTRTRGDDPRRGRDGRARPRTEPRPRVSMRLVPARAHRAVARSCPASGCSRSTPLSSRRARGPASSSMSGPVTGPGWCCAGRSRSTPSTRGPARSRSISGPSAAGPSGSPSCGRATRVDMLGPLGRPFEVDPRSRHLLLIAGGLGIAGVRMLADEAIRDGRQVTLLFGGASAREVYPSSLLPDEVEYIVATDDGSLGHAGFVTELVPTYEAWADQAFACGPAGMLRALSALAVGRRERLGVAKLGRKRGARQARPDRVAGTRDARRSSRCRWNRTWAARSERASAASSWASAARPSGSAARAPSSPATRSPGRPAGEAEAPGRHGHGPGRGAAAPDRVAAVVAAAAGASPCRGGGADALGRPGAGVLGRRRSRRGRPRSTCRSTSPRPAGSSCANPILVASGTFGYGIEYGDVVDVDRLGAICCKGTTLKPRVGNVDAAGDRDAGRDAQLDRPPEPRASTRSSRSTRRCGTSGRRRSSSTWPGESIADYVEVVRRLDGVPASPASS